MNGFFKKIIASSVCILMLPNTTLALENTKPTDSATSKVFTQKDFKDNFKDKLKLAVKCTATVVAVSVSIYLVYKITKPQKPTETSYTYNNCKFNEDDFREKIYEKIFEEFFNGQQGTHRRKQQQPRYSVSDKKAKAQAELKAITLNDEEKEVLSAAWEKIYQKLETPKNKAEINIYELPEIPQDKLTKTVLRFFHTDKFATQSDQVKLFARKVFQYYNDID